jgi:hypothetical protein
MDHALGCGSRCRGIAAKSQPNPAAGADNVAPHPRNMAACAALRNNADCAVAALVTCARCGEVIAARIAGHRTSAFRSLHMAPPPVAAKCVRLRAARTSMALSPRLATAKNLISFIADAMAASCATGPERASACTSRSG